MYCIQCLSNVYVGRYEIVYISAINSYIIKPSKKGRIPLCDECTKKTKKNKKEVIKNQIK